MDANTARARLQGLGYTVTVNMVAGGGAPFNSVVSAVPADPNLAPGSLVTINASDGSGGSGGAPGAGGAGGAGAAAPANPSPAAPSAPAPSGPAAPQAPEAPVDLDDIGRQLGDAADNISNILGGNGQQ